MFTVLDGLMMVSPAERALSFLPLTIAFSSAGSLVSTQCRTPWLLPEEWLPQILIQTAHDSFDDWTFSIDLESPEC